MARRGGQEGRGALGRAALWVLVVGVLVTVTLVVSTYFAHDDNEDRLLGQRTAEVAAVLESSVQTVTGPLGEVATLAEADLDDDWASIEAAMRYQLAKDRFDAMAVFDLVDGERVLHVGEPLAVDDPRDHVGAEPASTSSPRESETNGQLQVVDLLGSEEPRIGYLHRPSPMSPVALYAERIIADPISPVDPGDAFAGVDYALYLGATEDRSSLVRASTADLPLDGRRADTSVPFGDTTLTLVASPTGVLGSSILAWLPWLVAAVGTVTTLAGASLVEAIHRRRRVAEALAQEVARLYGREHEIAHTLQRSLLPKALPGIGGVELAARYIAGTTGTEVGGDWYDVVDLDDDRLGVIVGDVAGRGVHAAAVMAAMRYASHTLAAEGNEPARLLTTINQLDSIRGDFVTMVAGIVDLHQRSITLAKAGHPPPLLIDGDRVEFLQAPTGPPIGFLPTSVYQQCRIALPEGATLVFCTDGLYERRGEDVDVSLERLRRTASSHTGTGLESLLDHLYGELVGDDGRDDVAIVAICLTG